MVRSGVGDRAQVARRVVAVQRAPARAVRTGLAYRRDEPVGAVAGVAVAHHARATVRDDPGLLVARAVDHVGHVAVAVGRLVQQTGRGERKCPARAVLGQLPAGPVVGQRRFDLTRRGVARPGRVEHAHHPIGGRVRDGAVVRREQSNVHPGPDPPAMAERTVLQAATHEQAVVRSAEGHVAGDARQVQIGTAHQQVARPDVDPCLQPVGELEGQERTVVHRAGTLRHARRTRQHRHRRVTRGQGEARCGFARCLRVDRRYPDRVGGDHHYGGRIDRETRCHNILPVNGQRHAELMFLSPSIQAPGQRKADANRENALCGVGTYVDQEYVSSARC